MAHLTQKIALWDQIKRSYNQRGGLEIEGCKIEGLLYYHTLSYLDGKKIVAGILLERFPVIIVDLDTSI